MLSYDRTNHENRVSPEQIMNIVNDIKDQNVFYDIVLDFCCIFSFDFKDLSNR